MYPTYAPVHDPTAVMGRRFGAWIIDFVIGAILVLVLLLSFATRDSYGTASRAQSVCNDINDNVDNYLCVPADTDVFLWKDTDIGIVFLIGLGYWFLNDAVLTGITGFSIGKGIVGLRVVRQRDGRLAGFGRSVGRWAMWIADWAPFCIPIVGLVTANASKGHRRVGDMVAGTFVVDKRQVGLVPNVAGVNATAPTQAVGYPGAYGPPPWPGAPGGGAPPVPGGYPPAWGTPPPAPWGAPQTPPAPWGAPQTPPAWGTPPPAPWGAPAAPPPWSQPAPQPPPDPSGAGPMWAPPPAPEPTPAAPDWAPPGPIEPTAVQSIVGEAPTEQLPAITPPHATGGPGIDGPLWDDARDAYIQWDPDINRWVQWDDATRQWHPL